MTTAIAILAAGTDTISASSKVPQPFQDFAPTIVCAFIGLLALLFYLMTSYSHRVDQTSYLASLFKRSLYTYEERELIKPIQEDWEAGRFHQTVLEDMKWREVVAKDEKTRQPRPADEIKNDYRVSAAESELRYNPWGNKRPFGMPPPGWRDWTIPTINAWISTLRLYELGSVIFCTRKHVGVIRQKSRLSRKMLTTAPRQLSVR